MSQSFEPNEELPDSSPVLSLPLRNFEINERLRLAQYRSWDRSLFWTVSSPKFWGGFCNPCKVPCSKFIENVNARDECQCKSGFKSFIIQVLPFVVRQWNIRQLPYSSKPVLNNNSTTRNVTISSTPSPQNMTPCRIFLGVLAAMPRILSDNVYATEKTLSIHSDCREVERLVCRPHLSFLPTKLFL